MFNPATVPAARRFVGPAYRDGLLLLFMPYNEIRLQQGTKVLLAEPSPLRNVLVDLAGVVVTPAWTTKNLLARAYSPGGDYALENVGAVGLSSDAAGGEHYEAVRWELPAAWAGNLTLTNCAFLATDNLGALPSYGSLWEAGSAKSITIRDSEASMWWGWKLKNGNTIDRLEYHDSRGGHNYTPIGSGRILAVVRTGDTPATQPPAIPPDDRAFRLNGKAYRIVDA